MRQMQNAIKVIDSNSPHRIAAVCHVRSHFREIFLTLWITDLINQKESFKALLFYQVVELIRIACSMKLSFLESEHLRGDQCLFLIDWGIYLFLLFIPWRWDFVFVSLFLNNFAEKCASTSLWNSWNDFWGSLHRSVNTYEAKDLELEDLDLDSDIATY